MGQKGKRTLQMALAWCLYASFLPLAFGPGVHGNGLQGLAMGLIGDVILPYMAGGFASDFPLARMIAYLGGLLFGASLLLPWLQYRFLARLGWGAIVGSSLFAIWVDQFVSFKSAILGVILDFLAGGAFRFFDIVASVAWTISFFSVNRAIDADFAFRKAWKIEFGEAPPRPFFYGQVICVLAIAIAVLASVPVMTFLGLANRISQEMGIPMKELVTYGGMGRILGFLPLLFVGHFQDRYGQRANLGVTMLLLGMACIAATAAQGPWTYLLACFVLQALGLSLTMIGANAVSFWYEKRLGLAEGALGLKSPLISLAFLPNFFLELERSGMSWRWTFVILGVIILVILTPLFWFAFRNRPSDLGKEMDGEPSDASTPPHPGPQLAAPTWGQFCRSPAFWTVIIGLSAVFFVENLTHHQMLSILKSDTLTPFLLTRDFSILMALGCLLMGVAVDRFPEKYGMATAIGLVCLGLTIVFQLFPVLSPINGWHLVGLAEGALLGASGPYWARHFGRAHLGKIRALILVLTQAVFGWFVPWFFPMAAIEPGSPFTWIWVGVCLLAGVAILLTRVPNPPSPGGQLPARSHDPGKSVESGAGFPDPVQ